jgi:hypothetical protein
MLIIRGVEVSQAIQYFRAEQHLTDPADRGPDNSLSVVANKVAWARVYVETDAPGTIPNVTGTLDVNYGLLNTNAGQPGLTLNPQPPGTVTAQFNPDYPTTRGSSTLTLNFIIPAERMFGPLTLTAAVTSGDGTQTASQSLFISASLRQTLKLRGIMIGYQGPDPANPGNMLTIAAPGLTDLQTTAAWALRVMPVQASAVFQVASTITRNVPLTGTATNGGCTTDWYNLNAAIATAKTADGNHPGFLYYGLIASSFPNTSNNGGCESSGVSSGFNGGQTAMTHEIGHACGRAHGPCGSVGTSADPNYPAYEPYDSPAARVASIGEYGLDITTGAVPTPSTARDYMSYCGPSWISIYGHQALVDNAALNPEQVGVWRPWWLDYVAYDPWWWLHYIPDPPPYWIDPADIREIPSHMEPIISIIGVLHPDDRVEVLSVTRSAVLNMDVAGATTDLRAVLHGAKKGELASAPVIAMPSHGSCGCKHAPEAERPILFQALISDVAPGSALSIRRGTNVLWRRAAPKSAPTASSPRVRRLSDGTVEVAWTSRGRAVDAWVRVSADEGKTWRAAATAVTGRRAVIDAAHLPAGKLQVEVVLHNGFHSTRSKPVTFQNALIAPVPAILHPHEGRRLVAGETLYLWGSVAEQQGSSRDFRYAWTIDGKAAGQGLQVFTRVPSEGTHHCELSVGNAKGERVGTASVRFVSVAAPERTT